MVLYQLLTGQKPYRLKTRTPEEVSRAIIEQEPVRPSTAVAKSNGSSKSQTPNPKLLRGDLDNIVLMALRKEPERRYQSVEQLSEDIRRHLQALPVRARKDTLAYRSAKFVQRNRSVTVAATLVFLTLLGGIIATTWQAHRAKLEKARAERRFNEVRQLAHSVLFDYHDAIKNLPGATRVRERLVKDALNYLDSLTREAGGDPALQRELAAAYDRVGDVRGEADGASLGDRAGAMDSYGKALRIREALLAAAPRDVQSRRDLAASYRKIGNEMLETSEAVRGVEYLQKSVVSYSSLSEEEPLNANLRRELAGVYNDLGGALEDRGDMAGALDQHRRAMRLRDELLAAEPANAQARRDLSVTYVNTGRVLYFTGDIAGAIKINRKAIELRTRLVTDDSTNTDYRRLLAIGYQNDGDYHAGCGDINGALESFRKKIVIDQQSLTADPDNVQAQDDHAYSSERIGVLLMQLGNYLEAVPHLYENLKARENIAAHDPQSVDERYKVSLAHGEIATAQAQLGNSSQALEQYGQCLTLLEQLPVDPTKMYLRGLEAQAYGWLGRTQVELANRTGPADVKDRWRAARESYQRAFDIWQDLRARRTIAADDVPKLNEVVNEIAKCDSALAARE